MLRCTMVEIIQVKRNIIWKLEMAIRLTIGIVRTAFDLLEDDEEEDEDDE